MLDQQACRGRVAKRVGAEVEEVVPPVFPELLAEDVDQLPTSQKLVESGPYSVFIAASKQIPNVLYEIGRLREITFRGVSEGTGESIDLSWFDYHYLHLFLWSREQKEVVGAYRIGQTDLILPRFGPHGLYTSPDYSSILIISRQKSF